MTLKANGFWSMALSTGLVAGLAAQAPVAPVQGQQAIPTFRVQIDAVTMDAIVKDQDGRFVPDLTKDEFEIYEDGVLQEIVTMTMVHGGRVTNVLAPAPPAVPEGVMLPPRRVANDTSGRIFVFFVDDLHLRFNNSGQVRGLFQKISQELVHDGDMFGIVSSGPSSIHVDMTYDKRRLDEAIEKIAGDGLSPDEIITRSSGSSGVTELRHRAHVAFSTMHELLENMEKITNRRKALVWISEGYDFNPFQASRYGLLGADSPFTQNAGNLRANTNVDETGDPERGNNVTQQIDPLTRGQMQSETFSDSDLALELGDLTRSANRANTSIYTIDPRGLVAGFDIDEQLDPNEFREFLRTTQDTLRVLAEETGGIAVVNQNNFDKALKQIDAETSDYYVLGYYSSNPDSTQRRRRIEIKLTRPDTNVVTRSEYVLRAAPPPPVPVAPDR